MGKFRRTRQSVFPLAQIACTADVVIWPSSVPASPDDAFLILDTIFPIATAPPITAAALLLPVSRAAAVSAPGVFAKLNLLCSAILVVLVTRIY